MLLVLLMTSDKLNIWKRFETRVQLTLGEIEELRDKTRLVKVQSSTVEKASEPRTKVPADLKLAAFSCDCYFQQLLISL